MQVSPRKCLFSGAPAAGTGDRAPSPSRHLTLGKPPLCGFPRVKSSERGAGGGWPLLRCFCPKARIGPKCGKIHSSATCSRKAGLSVCLQWMVGAKLISNRSRHDSSLVSITYGGDSFKPKFPSSFKHHSNQWHVLKYSEEHIHRRKKNP